ncbi:MAG: hypothetical protein FWD14_01770 [Treponema sp.]|nr:hypothetical protein [Treponema sp.]
MSYKPLLTCIKTVFVFSCFFLLIFAYSCKSPDDEIEYVDIRIYNETIEDVTIYYFRSYSRRYSVAAIKSYENKLIKLEKNRTYYAEGDSSNKSYGNRSFSSYNVWFIK